MKPILEFDAVSKIYRPASAAGAAVKALDEVHFSMKAGEFVSIIGPSGCGKTTLLKMAGGILPWDAGQVRVMGQVVCGPGPERAIVFQSFALLPWLNVLDNAAFGLKMRGVAASERRAKAMALLQKMGLDGFAHAWPSALSGGMQQRVGLARALAVQPSLLLMDEPFSALDAQTRRVLQDELMRVWKDTGLSVLFITHAMDEAVFLSDRILVMGARPGRIVEEITVQLPRPRTERTRREPLFAELTGKVWDSLRLSGQVQAAGAAYGAQD